MQFIIEARGKTLKAAEDTQAVTSLSKKTTAGRRSSAPR